MSTVPNLSAVLASAVFLDGELHRRPVPATDFAQYKAPIQDLAARMVDDPEAVLSGFVELAMKIAGGVSAGLSILEDGPGAGVFRWRHLHGSLSAVDDATTPRDFRPRGVTLDRRAPVLTVHSERA